MRAPIRKMPCPALGKNKKAQNDRRSKIHKGACTTEKVIKKMPEREYPVENVSTVAEAQLLKPLCDTDHVTLGELLNLNIYSIFI